nr:unnamed protein product [Spirometra erinaceieuropaei]
MATATPAITTAKVTAAITTTDTATNTATVTATNTATVMAMTTAMVMATNTATVMAITTTMVMATITVTVTDQNPAQALSYEYDRGYDGYGHYLRERYELPSARGPHHQEEQWLPSQYEFTVIPERREKRRYQRVHPKSRNSPRHGGYLFGLRGKNFMQHD